MPRPKRFSELRRQLLRKLPQVDDWTLCRLRNLLWDIHIAREFKAGLSVEILAKAQPDRNLSKEIEAAIRRVMR